MKYEQDELMDKATLLFWQKGFQAAGMRDIQLALDMRPGSIYARFKNKEHLFHLVLTRYVSNSQMRLQQVCDSPDALDALREFFVFALLHPNDLRFMRQCLLVRSLTEIELLSDSTKAAVIEGLASLQASFASIIEKAIEQERLSSHTPLEFAAGWLQNQFVGLRNFALMQDSDEAIMLMIDKLFIDLQAQWPATLH